MKLEIKLNNGELFVDMEENDANFDTISNFKSWCLNDESPLSYILMSNNLELILNKDAIQYILVKKDSTPVESTHTDWYCMIKIFLKESLRRR